ncbi:hypothetical protein [Mangrovibacterium sp.]|uniref:hypothetical protein n=1 Tax=Mangrovibacterium sp. TaxID=1961364 RepID=UPI003567E399
MSKIIFQVDSPGTKFAIALALSMLSQTGIEPDELILDSGKTFHWDKQKAIQYLKGLISENELVRH